MSVDVGIDPPPYVVNDPPESYLREKHKKWIKKIGEIYKVEVKLVSTWNKDPQSQSEMISQKDTATVTSKSPSAPLQDPKTPQKKPDLQTSSSPSSVTGSETSKSPIVSSTSRVPKIASISPEVPRKKEKTQEGDACTSTFLSRLRTLATTPRQTSSATCKKN